MSQLTSHQAVVGSTLDFNNLVEKQRRLLQEMSSSTSANGVQTKITQSHTVSEPGQVTDDEEQEWISNWQFKRVPSTRKPDVKSPAPPTNTTNDEGGVFYFERIAPARVSSSDSDIGDGARNRDFDSPDFFLDMTIENDDLFADLEAAAVSNDDSQISLDDFMDMENDQPVHNHVQQCYQTFMHDDVDDFLNKSNNTASTALMDDDDMDMMSNHECDDIYSHSSPVRSKGPMSNHYGYTNSPTSVAQHAQHMMSPLISGCAMSSASTRPALQEMRKMMTELMDNGNMSRSSCDSRLPCAEGMDQMYLETVQKLSASMARTKKTRESLSLTMQSMQHTNQEYDRVNQVLQSVQTSSQQVDSCLQSIRMMSV